MLVRAKCTYVFLDGSVLGISSSKISVAPCSVRLAGAGATMNDYDGMILSYNIHFWSAVSPQQASPWSTCSTTGSQSIMSMTSHGTIFLRRYCLLYIYIRHHIIRLSSNKKYFLWQRLISIWYLVIKTRSIEHKRSNLMIDKLFFPDYDFVMPYLSALTKDENKMSLYCEGRTRYHIFKIHTH